MSTPIVSYEISVDAREVRSEAASWPEQARALRIVDDETYRQAAELLKAIKALRTRIDQTFGPHIKRAFEAHRALCHEKQAAEVPLTDAETILKRACSAWDMEQERRARAEEIRLRELAKLEAERQQLAEAAQLERDGYLEEAEAVLNAPVETPAVVVTKSTPKVTGISYREVWKFRVIDASRIPTEYLAVDTVKIGGVVRALKGATKIPGVEVYAERVTAASGR